MSFTDEFVQPSAPGGDPLDLNMFLGSLLVIDVSEVVDHIATVHTKPGEQTPAVRGDVHVVDGPHAGTTRKDALIFPRVMQGQLKGNVGKKVLGRLRRGTAKPGQSAPWELAPATEADMAAAREWASRRAFTPAASPSSEAPF